jgi:20S proteasome subunit beta 3
MNGGTCLALTGKNCVIMASDSRFSLARSSTMVEKFPREIYRIGSKSLVGASGLDFHYEWFVNALRRTLEQQSDSILEPDHIANSISSLLYKYEGLYLSTLLAGVSDNELPYLCSFDGLGALTKTDKFAAVGTSAATLSAILEATYRPNLEPEELCCLTERCLKLAFQRDIMSGGDIKIVTLKKDGIYSKTIKIEDV